VASPRPEAPPVTTAGRVVAPSDVSRQARHAGAAAGLGHHQRDRGAPLGAVCTGLDGPRRQALGDPLAQRRVAPHRRARQSQGRRRGV
jgi:hypothetical protein